MNITSLYDFDDWMPISLDHFNNGINLDTKHENNQSHVRAGWAAASPGALMQVNASSMYPYYPYMNYRYPLYTPIYRPYNYYGYGYNYNPFLKYYPYSMYF